MLRSGRVPGLTPALFLGVAMMAGCADSSTAPSSPDAARAATASMTGEVCEEINFTGLAHGTVVTNQLSIFGSPLAFSATAHNGAGKLRATEARIYSAGNTTGPDFDLETSGLCPSCATLGSMLIIQDLFEAPVTSDHVWGGQIKITGFPAGTYIKSFVLADHESPEEPDAQLIVDGLNIAAAGQADLPNAIQTVMTTQQRLITSDGVTFILGVPGTPPALLGSEAVDNIQVCQRVRLGDDGCTPGYWKNHRDSWPATGYSTGQSLKSVFASASSISASFGNQSLHTALQGGGGPGVLGGAKILARAATAAILNAGHPDVDYAQTAASIISAVNAAFASGDRDTMIALAGTLDDQNNAGCPIN